MKAITPVICDEFLCGVRFPTERGLVWVRAEAYWTSEFIGKTAQGEKGFSTTARVDALQGVYEDSPFTFGGVETPPTPVREEHTLFGLPNPTGAWLTKNRKSIRYYAHKQKTPISGGQFLRYFAPD